MKIFSRKFVLFFLIFARRGGSNKYQQSMFWSKNKKKSTPYKPQFCYLKAGFEGLHISRTCFPDVILRPWFMGQFIFFFLFFSSRASYCNRVFTIFHDRLSFHLLMFCEPATVSLAQVLPSDSEVSYAVTGTANDGPA